MTCKDTRLNMLAALRALMDTLTSPHLTVDVSDAVLSSIELGIRSVSWDIVKKELDNDPKFNDLSKVDSKRMWRASFFATKPHKTILEIARKITMCIVCTDVR